MQHRVAHLIEETATVFAVLTRVQETHELSRDQSPSCAREACVNMEVSFVFSVRNCLFECSVVVRDVRPHSFLSN